jgi:hypothetical protein
MGRTLQGRTEDAKEAPYLGADFWKIGVKIVGAVEEVKTLTQGIAYVIAMREPVKIGEDEVSEVQIGNLAGFRKAISATGLKQLPAGCFIEIECTSVKKATKADYSDSPNFAIKVTIP